jgi:hypothetical protein
MVEAAGVSQRAGVWSLGGSADAEVSSMHGKVDPE